MSVCVRRSTSNMYNQSEGTRALSSSRSTCMDTTGPMRSSPCSSPEIKTCVCVKGPLSFSVKGPSIGRKIARGVSAPIDIHTGLCTHQSNIGPFAHLRPLRLPRQRGLVRHPHDVLQAGRGLCVYLLDWVGSINDDGSGRSPPQNDERAI